MLLSFLFSTLSSDLSTQALFVALWRLIVSDHKLIVDYQICYFYFLYRPPDCQICYLYFLSTTSCQMRFFGHVVCVATVRGLKPAPISCQMKILLAMWFVHCPLSTTISCQMKMLGNPTPDQPSLWPRAIWSEGSQLVKINKVLIVYTIVGTIRRGWRALCIMSRSNQSIISN